MPVELRIPDIGESVTEAQIGRWLKAEGEHVEKDEPVVELESDKATLELPAPAAGTITGPLKASGAMAAIGEVVGYIQDGAGAPHGGPAPVAAPPGAPVAGPAKAPAGPAPSPAPAAPSEEAKPKPRGPGQGQERVPATGAGSPTRGASPAANPARPAVKAAPASSGGRQEDVVPMTALRRRIAQRLVEAQHNAALLTTFNEVDMTGVMALRRQLQEAFQGKYAVKLGLMSFFVKGVIDALRQFPALNAEVRGTDIAYRNYFDIGVALSTERGLVVPVLRDAQALSFAEIERGIADFAARGHDNRLRVDELQGGTFTITNGGVFGSLLSTPIVSPPQSGVLGMHTIQDRPVARNGAVVIRPMMYLALTYDHRVVDGREAIGFLKRVITAIEEPARMLIEV